MGPDFELLQKEGESSEAFELRSKIRSLLHEFLDATDRGAIISANDTLKLKELLCLFHPDSHRLSLGGDTEIAFRDLLEAIDIAYGEEFFFCMQMDDMKNPYDLAADFFGVEEEEKNSIRIPFRPEIVWLKNCGYNRPFEYRPEPSICIPASSATGPCKYALIAAISGRGHAVAYIRDRSDNSFLKCDDHLTHERYGALPDLQTVQAYIYAKL